MRMTHATPVASPLLCGAAQTIVVCVSVQTRWLMQTKIAIEEMGADAHFMQQKTTREKAE